MFDFHFLRPWVLILLPILIVCYYFMRKSIHEPKQSQPVVAPHLVDVLTPKQSIVDRFKPIDLIAIVSVFTIIAAAGPAWFKQQDDQQKPPIAVVLKVSDAMLANDIAPNRLRRAKQKIEDLMAYRSPAKTALFAYSQTSHRVLPLTEDHGVFKPFIDALAPDVMPGGGKTTDDDAADAVAMAYKELENYGGGTVVVLADDFSRVQVQKLQDQGIEFVWWQFSTEQGGVIIDDQSNTVIGNQGGGVMLSRNSATEGALTLASPVEVSVDSSDLVTVDKLVDQLEQQHLADNDAVPYQDMAWYFTWPALILCALWFRRGWTSSKRVQISSWLTPLCVVALLNVSPSAHASVKDWFLTADQQGMLAYKQNNFEQAAALFEDPYWRARSLYEMGKYVPAADIFATFGTADGFYNRGNALLKAQNYQGAINAYETALKSDPEHQDAKHNLVLAKKALELVIEMGGGVDMEQSITVDVDGDEMADDFDGEGQDYSVQSDLDADSKEAWMRSVDSQMSDFLSTKFNTEANSQEGQ